MVKDAHIRYSRWRGGCGLVLRRVSIVRYTPTTYALYRNIHAKSEAAEVMFSSMPPKYVHNSVPAWVGGFGFRGSKCYKIHALYTTG